MLKFQQQTQAKIIVVSYFHESYRKLKNGLSHKDFTRNIRELRQTNRVATRKTSINIELSFLAVTLPISPAADSGGTALADQPLSEEITKISEILSKTTLTKVERSLLG